MLRTALVFSALAFLASAFGLAPSWVAPLAAGGLLACAFVAAGRAL